MLHASWDWKGHPFLPSSYKVPGPSLTHSVLFWQLGQNPAASLLLLTQHLSSNSSSGLLNVTRSRRIFSAPHVTAFLFLTIFCFASFKIQDTTAPGAAEVPQDHRPFSEIFFLTSFSLSRIMQFVHVGLLHIQLLKSTQAFPDEPTEILLNIKLSLQQALTFTLTWEQRTQSIFEIVWKKPRYHWIWSRISH